MPIAHLGTTSVPGRISRLARMPQWLMGLTSIRGRACTVVDMRCVLEGRPCQEPGVGCLAVLSASLADNLALLWPSMMGLSSMTQYEQIHAASAHDAVVHPWVASLWRDQRGADWRLLDVEAWLKAYWKPVSPPSAVIDPAVAPAAGGRTEDLSAGSDYGAGGHSAVVDRDGMKVTA